jgi:hypothetical protein
MFDKSNVSASSMSATVAGRSAHEFGATTLCVVPPRRHRSRRLDLSGAGWAQRRFRSVKNLRAERRRVRFRPPAHSRRSPSLTSSRKELRRIRPTARPTSAADPRALVEDVEEVAEGLFALLDCDDVEPGHHLGDQGGVLVGALVPAA